jgi:hypothetical protein
LLQYKETLTYISDNLCKELNSFELMSVADLLKIANWCVPPDYYSIYDLQPSIMTKMPNIFSLSVFGATLPNPTEMSPVNVK